MCVFPLILTAAVAVTGLAALPSIAGAQDAIVITTNQDAYVDEFGADPFVHITVSGLAECAGQTVEAVLFAASGPSSVGDPPVPFAGRVVAVDVPESGAFVADVRSLWEQFGTVVYPGVRGDCVPGGYVVGDGITFYHSDPPFAPIIPLQPLPPGIAINASQVDEVTVVVNLSGFAACADRRVAVHLGTETGGPIFADPNRGVDADATFDANGDAFAALSLTGVPAGRYAVWIRSVCTWTRVGPDVIELTAPVPPVDPTPATPGPPVAGNGAMDTNAQGVSWLFLGAAAVFGAAGTAGAVAVARRR